MKILVVLPRFPYPLEKGDKLRAFHQLRVLSQYHELYLVALNETTPDDAALEKIRPFCKEIHVVHLSLASRLWHSACTLFNGLPFQCGYFYNYKAQHKINELVNRVQPDRIYCQLLRVTEYVKHFDIKKVLDYQDVLSKGMQRRAENSTFVKKWFFQSEYKRLSRYEREVFNAFDEKVIITEVDRNLIPHAQSEQIHVVANGVDFDQYRHRDQEKNYDLIFSGNMGYAPNVEAAQYLAKEVMPLLWEKYPDLTLALCGAKPAPAVRALANSRVVVTGWVDSMADYYAQSRIFIAPMHLGTGLQNKLLEAMSMKLPCITSPLAGKPLKGVESGKEILICNTTTGFADAVGMLLENPELYARISENGYNFVRSHYNWETVNQKLSGIISEAGSSK